jgi:hypothetical protein
MMIKNLNITADGSKFCTNIIEIYCMRLINHQTIVIKTHILTKITATFRNLLKLIVILPYAFM